jgi:uncharacterized membrane protein YeaQ/YmgE (transglycosylase-associated protein family)
VIALLVYLVVVGLIVGALARLALPGPDPIGILGTIAVGIAGSFLGGLVTWALFGRTGGFIVSLIGSIVLLALYRKYVQRRPITGPHARDLPRRRV